jgi:hypothetical protein
MRIAMLGAAVAVCGAAAMGCVDARDEYNDFDNRLVDAAGTGADAPIVSELPDVNGMWVIKAKPGGVTGEFYFYFTTSITFTPTSANTGHLAWQPQPLDYDEWVPVGELFDASEGDIDNTATGEFALDGLLPGRANSLTQADVTLDAFVIANLMSADFICGSVGGYAGTYPLNGSTFTATRWDGSTITSELALGLPHHCPE